MHFTVGTVPSTRHHSIVANLGTHLERNGLMKMHIRISTPKGFYKEYEYPISTVKKGLDSVLPILDNLPDEIGDEKTLDWSRIIITFKRD